MEFFEGCPHQCDDMRIANLHQPSTAALQPSNLHLLFTHPVWLWCSKCNFVQFCSTTQVRSHRQVLLSISNMQYWSFIRLLKITFSTDCDESMKSSYLLLFVDGSYEVFAVFYWSGDRRWIWGVLFVVSKYFVSR